MNGLTKDDIVLNKAGKLVSRKKSALGKKFDRVKGWRESFMKARAVGPIDILLHECTV